MSLRMQTVAENSSRITLDCTFVILRLPKLEYLVLNLTALAIQLARYQLAESDMSEYV